MLDRHLGTVTVDAAICVRALNRVVRKSSGRLVVEMYEGNIADGTIKHRVRRRRPGVFQSAACEQPHRITGTDGGVFGNINNRQVIYKNHFADRVCTAGGICSNEDDGVIAGCNKGVCDWGAGRRIGSAEIPGPGIGCCVSGSRAILQCERSAHTGNRPAKIGADFIYTNGIQSQ